MTCNDIMLAANRHHRAIPMCVAVTVVLAGCGNQSGRAPVPPHYDWPDGFAYRITSDADFAVGTAARASVAWRGVTRFEARNERYVVWNDSVARTRAVGGSAPVPVGLEFGDTLRHFVRLSRYGGLDDIQPDCDPSVPLCGNVLPSLLPRQLRHLIPRLPVWWPPRGHPWVDTLRFDDRPRPGGGAGSVVISYRDPRDTVAAGRPAWLIAWRSVTVMRDSADREGAAPVIETGAVFVDKGTLVPARAWWSGTFAVPGGGTTTWRGTARLLTSAFDSTEVGP